MNKSLLAVGLVGGLLFGLESSAFAHGGQYRGPGDSVPPTEGPGPGTGGPNTGGPVTGGPGGPVTPGGGRGPTTPGGGPVVPGGGGPPRGPVTSAGGKKNKPTEGFEQWQFWWENNKDPYLNLKASLAGGAVKSGSAGFLAGMGRREESETSNRPSASEAQQQIVPVLKSMLKEKDADIVDSAVLALGRIVKSESADTVLEDIKSVLGNSNPTAQQAAVLSLGVLGSTSAIPTLTDVLNDTPAGRQLMNEKGSIQDLPRSFAAIALGMIGDKSTIPTILDVIKKEKDSEIDLKGSAILALGLFKEGRQDIVKELSELLKNDTLDRNVRAQIPIALGRLESDAIPTVPALRELILAKKTDNLLVQSCVIALGQLAAPEDKEVQKVLFDQIKDGSDEQSRHFSFIALAQIGDRAIKQSLEGNDEMLKGLNKFLLKEVTDPDTKTHQPWAGIALGLLGRAYPDSAEQRSLITSKVLDQFEKSSNPSYKSAFAISLGLLKANVAAETIFKEMSKTNDRNLKGYLAVSLGMMRHREAIETLRGLVLDDADDKMRLQVATSLGLMGDSGAVATLLDSLKKASTLNVTSSLARALGLIGDRQAVQPLVSLVNDAKSPGLARAFGCVALGLLAEKTALYWNTPLSVNSNYRTVIPAQYEILDIL